MEWNEQEWISEAELDELLGAWKVSGPSEGLRAAVFPGAKRVPRWRSGAWIAAVAACLVAAILVGGLWNRTKKRAVVEGAPQPFVAIPYTVPLGRDESATVVRMNVSVAELQAAGFRLPAADGAEMMSADVLFGEDGRAHAVRLIGMASREN